MNTPHLFSAVPLASKFHTAQIVPHRPKALSIVIGLSLLAYSLSCSAINISQYPLFIGTINKANVLLILDNSNSMDEEPSGTTACSAVGKCGSASDNSKSQIARTAAKSLVTTYANRINMGLMAYRQSGVAASHLHNSPYDVSYNPANYDATFTGARESTTKRYRISNPTSPGNFIHYNVALPFYDTVNNGNAFCYSTTAVPFSAAALDTYRCFSTKTGTSDTIPTWQNNASEAAQGYAGLLFQSAFGPTDSDLAQGILDFGKQTTWNYVGPTWFANTSPGRGYLHVPIAALDNAQATKLNTKLGVSQFVNNKPTDAAFPLQNAGLTPIEGTLITAKDYFLGNLSAANEGGPQGSPPNSCGKNFVVLITDGLPSTDKTGTAVSDPTAALTAAATAATDLKQSTSTVETYVIGFALPYGVDPNTLDTIASAGGTTTAYSASDLTTLNARLGTIFTDILTKTGSASSVATNSTNLQTESRIFQAKFSSADWSGQLLQFQLDDLTNVGTPTAEWDAGVKINAQSANSRVIITKGDTNGDGVADDGVPFRWSVTALTAAQQTYLNTDAAGTPDALGSSRVDYLRGDASNEGSGAGNFRTRTFSKLGDIVNSNPWYVGIPEAGYSDVDHPGYTAFRNAALSRTPVVYVGGNDGMLHGFDASLDFSSSTIGAPTGTSGNEVLAYVPSAVYPNLSKLTSQTYNQNQNHSYFVDGSPMVADAYLGATWTTVLIGGMGAGGKGYYALDVTNPTNFTEANAADLLLWEFTVNDDADVGFAFNYPAVESNKQAKQIVKMANGQWAAILGNGFNSASGKAALYILFINAGKNGWDSSDFVKIVADVPVAQDNGLSTPTPYDTDGDGYVDTVYAGDLKGNLWKFLVGPNTGDNTVTSDPTTWKLALSTSGCTTDCTPLFVAKDGSNNRQPIIWPPSITPHPTSGTMIQFGTGKYLESTDNTSTSVQSFYGIRDEGSTLSGRGVLIPQTITTATVGSTTFRTITEGCGTNPLPACPPAGKGWYVDLPTSGERVTGVPQLDSGSIFFNTFVPPAGQCDSGGTGWLMALNYLTGTLPNGRIFDTNADSAINSIDTIVAGAQIGAALGGTTLIRGNAPGEAGVGVSSLTSGQLIKTTLGLGLGSRGRITWREILQ